MLNKIIFSAAVLAVFAFSGCTTVPPASTTSDADIAPVEKDTEVSVEVVGDDEVMDDAIDKVTLDDSPVYEDYTEAKYLAVKGKEPFVLFFHADWCPICRQMEKAISADLENYPKGTRFLKADYDSEDELKKEYDIKVQSTVVVVDGSGDVIYTAQDPALDDLKAAIEKSIGV